MSGKQIKITLAEALIKYLDEQVANGNGISRSDVISQAIQYQRFKDELRRDTVDEAVNKIFALVESHEISDKQKATLREIIFEVLGDLKKV
ncbi:ribbon-helix-helix domain-containing protein [Methanospirillum stamsii]|uniref:Uncharacterized protein n=1 Tax=Methanospirillum stamsii TaxID=1277351 RepID=A0A2V2N4U8_9EURY|nr:ribbon-helix-helix domain-containing protein [Methanospirillum stamsii]PWR74849.1 hypothetical protein DLD82_08095 [Methanospirillum stamsii]